MTKPGLASLIHPVSLSDFLPHLESGSFFTTHVLKGQESLTGLAQLESLDKLLSAWTYPVQSYQPKIADEAGAIDVSASEARIFFNKGMSLMFDHAERLSSELKVWLEAIRKDLGFSSLTQSRCLVYATPHGKGTSPHFDQNANFVLQVRGKKKWWLAANRSVLNPLSRYTMGLDADPELQTYLEGPMPTKMPGDAQVVELKPGSLLFVPAGMWHSTVAEGEAISLNFTYHAPSWLDLLTSALRSRLALSSEWRKTAHGVSDPLRSEKASQELDRLLLELTVDLPHWTAAEILGATEFEAESRRT